MLLLAEVDCAALALPLGYVGGGRAGGFPGLPRCLPASPRGGHLGWHWVLYSSALYCSVTDRPILGVLPLTAGCN